MEGPPPTVAFVLRSSADYLRARSLPEPEHTAALLLGRLLKTPPLQLPLRGEEALDAALLAAMRRGLKRAGEGEPVQHILGAWEFMGRAFRTDRRALIPRPETEELTRRVLDCSALWNGAGPQVLADVGTGSGCIAVTLALERPQATLVALDVSEPALELARENAARLGAAERVVFLQAELSDAVEPESLHAIVANLPYLTTAEYDALPPHIRDFEPREALDGGPDGLQCIRPLVEDAACALQAGGWLFLEIGASQGAAVARLLREQGFTDVAVLRDMAGRERIVEGRLPAE